VEVRTDYLGEEAATFWATLLVIDPAGWT